MKNRIDIKPVAYIEGLVYLGQVKHVEVVDCSPGYKRVIALTSNGERLSTRCLPSEAAHKLASVWQVYIKREWNVLLER